MEPNTFVEAGHQVRTAPLGGSLPRRVERPSQSGLIGERLPFRVRIVRNEEDLDKAVSIRHSAYGRHIPAVAALLEQAEACDTEPGSAVLLAESNRMARPWARCGSRPTATTSWRSSIRSSCLRGWTARARRKPPVLA